MHRNNRTDTILCHGLPLPSPLNHRGPAHVGSSSAGEEQRSSSCTPGAPQKALPIKRLKRKSLFGFQIVLYCSTEICNAKMTSSRFIKGWCSYGYYPEVHNPSEMQAMKPLASKPQIPQLHTLNPKPRIPKHLGSSMEFTAPSNGWSALNIGRSMGAAGHRNLRLTLDNRS